MTRANGRPVRRAVLAQTPWELEHQLPGVELVAEVRDLSLTLRPLGARRGGPQEVVLPWGYLYQHGMKAKLAAEQAQRRKRRR